MLDWRRDTEGLRANGYLIRSAAPFRWVLNTDVPAATTAVHVVNPPLATTRTLSEAKREAELHRAETHRADVMHRWLATLISSICAMVFAAGAPVPWNFFLTLALATLCLRAIGFMLGLALSRWTASVDDLFYQ